jgi:hypothetical protein
MLNQTISILATIAVLACPFQCSAARHGAVATEAPAARCACCHHAETLPDSTPRNDGTNDSEDCCQCICGGAVLEQVYQQEVHLDAGTWIVPSDIEKQTSIALVNLNGAARHLLKPDDGMNPGRRKCCLFMTFLC